MRPRVAQQLRIGALLLLIQVCAVTSRAADKPDGAGIWEGVLDVGAAKLKLVFHFDQSADGAWSGAMDSPDQGAEGLPLQPVAWKDGEVTCEMKAIGGVYNGKLNDAKDQLDGKWSQGGQKWPLVLKKVDKVSKPERPQEPKAPFPYRVEEVKFAGPSNDVQLAGTLTLPEGKGPFAAVILISGSGQQDRDETIFHHKPFLVLADALTRGGVAVLRVDDRGVGGSQGEVFKATTRDFANDVRAEIKFLQGPQEIDSQRIGLLGHSEGGLIGPLVAADNSDIAFLVLLAAPGVTGEEIMYRQGDLLARAAGAKDDAVTNQLAMQKRLFSVVRENLDDQATAKKLAEVVDASYASLPADERAKLKEQRELVEQQLSLLQSPWLRFFLTYDPRPTLEKLTCPVLALNGGKDLQVDPAQNLPVLREAFTASGNKDVTIEELPGLNHLFQHCENGGVTEYGQITETFSPEALKLIVDWVAARAKK